MIDDVESAALYGTSGRLTFSTSELGGADLAPLRAAAAVRATLEGQQIRTAVEKTTGRDGSTRTVLRQLVPIWFGDRAAGVLVTERDYAPIARSVTATFVPIALVLEGVLLILFVSLFPVLSRATRQIDSHMEEIEHQALHDSLTGLPNRVLFHDRIETALANARRTGGRAAVLLLDLDGFKEINDALGHASGDELLPELAARLRRTLRDTDTIARLGGDEFGVVMPAGGGDDVLETATRIHEASRSRSRSAASRSRSRPRSAACCTRTMRRIPTRSCGSPTWRCMRQSGTARGSSSTTPPRRLQPRSLSLGSELRRALDARRHRRALPAEGRGLERPDRRCRGARPLGSPERGLVLPSQFLPVVQKAGLMSALTTLVLRRAAARRPPGRGTGSTSGSRSTSTSTRCSTPHFPDASRRCSRRRPAAELADDRDHRDVADGGPRAGRRVARELAAIGVRLSIDDFGTGYSSLGYLTALPLAELKIDRSFVGRMTESPMDMAIVRTILDLGSNLDLSVVAEGIESAEARDLLEELGCTLAQGYEFGSPMSAGRLTAFLRSLREVDCLQLTA